MRSDLLEVEKQMMVLPYNEITIDHVSVPQCELNIENKQRSNLFSWNGQFSPQFIEALLTNYSCESDVIFDPFLGSGTVLYEAGRKNLSAFGTELNASAFYMAKTYELINLDLSERWQLVNDVESVLFSVQTDDDILPTIIEAIQNSNSIVTSNLLSTLVVLLDVYNNTLSIEFLQKKWGGLKEKVLLLPFSNNPISASMGDARAIPKEDDAATLLITSPPYINVFNYHQKYRRSVEALGYDVLAIAKNEFGSNRKHRGNRLLTVIQYCIDMALSIKETCRVCKKGSRMIYVVGRESNVLGYSFCNSRLIYEICTEIFRLPFLLRQERVFKNRFGQMIYEDILHFSCNKPNAEDLIDETIVNKARKIAVRMLKDKKQSNSDNKNFQFLEEAISKASQVNKSEG